MLHGRMNVRPVLENRGYIYIYIYERNSPRKNALNRVNIQSRIIMMEALPKSLTKLCMTYCPQTPPTILTAKRYSANMPAPKAWHSQFKILRWLNFIYIIIVDTTSFFKSIQRFAMNQLYKFMYIQLLHSLSLVLLIHIVLKIRLSI